LAKPIEAKMFNWDFKEFNSSNLTVVKNNVVGDCILTLIRQDYAENPVTMIIESANIEQKMKNITLRKVWEAEGKSQTFVMFAVDTSSYYVLYTIRNDKIVDKFMLSSWKL
jgi:hypothetical protein